MIAEVGIFECFANSYEDAEKQAKRKYPDDTIVYCRVMRDPVTHDE
jgi:hypothetical protein